MARKSATKAPQPAKDINRALRQKLAIQMRMEGHEWQYIAEMLGIPGGKGAAYHLVNSALKATLREASDELRTLEALRLDKLLTVYWPKALEGDGWSFDRVLRLMERRAKLLGIDMEPDSEIAKQGIIREYKGVDVVSISGPASDHVSANGRGNGVLPQ
jgi:hypothetical protein